MNSYKLIYLIWLLPLYLLGLTAHQSAVYFGLESTYTHGDSYTATVSDFDIKQIAAQTNGYVVLKFTTQDGATIERKLSLPVQLASQIMEIQVIPIRYQKDSFQEIVMMPTYETHREMVLMNIGVMLLSLLITLGIAIMAHRYAHQKLKQGDHPQELQFERVDLDQ
ncbi:MAG: hypothetical protein ACQETE_08165 [Bacteroidota bacterium]